MYIKNAKIYKLIIESRRLFAELIWKSWSVLLLFVLSACRHARKINYTISTRIAASGYPIGIYKGLAFGFSRLSLIFFFLFFSSSQFSFLEYNTKIDRQYIHTHISMHNVDERRRRMSLRDGRTRRKNRGGTDSKLKDKFKYYTCLFYERKK